MARTTTRSMSSRADSFEPIDNDFIVIDEPDQRELTLRPKASSSNTPQSQESPSFTLPHQNSPRLEINSIASESSFVVSVHPPAAPSNPIDHVPCDIVLVIDVSGSMAELAPLPDVDDEQERSAAGLTVLDLVRHLCRAIISTLNKNDRLALVTFSQDAKVKMELTFMNKRAKARILECVEGLKDEGATNLWAGIKTGLQQFEEYDPIGNVQTLYVLTDGMPNYMCPLPGYVPKLQPIMDRLARENGSKPIINTFGFGYSIRSDLMLSIAKVGHGNFSFISDVGMIGTIFVHAVANLYSTYATNAVLELTCSEDGTDDIKHTSGLPFGQLGSDRVAVQLGNIQYGQSRDLVIKCRPDRFRSQGSIQARLTYERGTARVNPIGITHSLIQQPSLSEAALAYHLSRDQLCTFFSTLFPIDGNILQHRYIRDINIQDDEANETDDDGNSVSFYHLVNRILDMPDAKTNPDLQSLLVDLIGPSLYLARGKATKPSGQVHQALDTTSKPVAPKNPHGATKVNWEKWGHHYLASLWCAHMRQICNSFKDAGPLRYGSASTLFMKCKTELDNQFDGLAPPKGTWRGLGYHRANGSSHRSTYTTPISMKRYNCVDNSCVLGDCKVLLANGGWIKAEDLRPGMRIWNSILQVEREVKEIVKGVNVAGGEICRVGNSEFCNDGSLWITSWHPIRVFDMRGEAFWTFPKNVAAETRPLANDESIYSILLAPDDNVDAHAITVENVTCVTLGHGINTSPHRSSDPRAHPFFGNYRTVTKSIKALTLDENGRRLCGGLVRDTESGLACGVLGASSSESLGTSEQKMLKGEDSALKARL